MSRVLLLFFMSLFLFGAHLSAVGHASAGFLATPTQTGFISDANSPPASMAVYGESTQIPYSSPSPDLNLQFYSGLEISSLHKGSVEVTNLHISVDATDPTGNVVPGQNLLPVSVVHGPDPNSANAQQLLGFIAKAILNAVPFGIGNDVQNAVAYTQSTPAPTGMIGNAVYGDWTSNAGSDYQSISFGFQLHIGSALNGTYKVNIHDHGEVTACGGYDSISGLCALYVVYSADASDTVYSCHVTCTQDFSIAPSSTSVAVNSGNSVTTGYSTITLTSQNSFAGAVDLTASASGQSLQLSLVPQSVTVPLAGSASSLLSVNAPWTSCKTGTFTVTVTSANGIGHSVTISVTTLSCPPPDFSFWASPTTAIFNSQAVASSAIYAQSVNGMTGTVSLGFTTSPSTGSNCALGDTGITLSSPGDWHSVGLLCGESTLGTYTVTVTGTWGTISHTLTVSFINQSSGGGCTSSNTCPKHT